MNELAYASAGDIRPYHLNQFMQSTSDITKVDPTWV